MYVSWNYTVFIYYERGYMEIEFDYALSMRHGNLILTLVILYRDTTDYNKLAVKKACAQEI